MKAAEINKIIKCEESFKMPGIVMNSLLSDPTEMFNDFMIAGESLDHDWFTEYFEEEHANKTKMAQDFTPPEVCKLLGRLIGGASVIGDICSGTGGLTIGAWNNNHGAKFFCYEYSERAIPLLLFNLCIRNIEAYVCRCDLLTGEEFEYWHVSHTAGQYGQVEKIDEFPPVSCDVCISNPPYSLKYQAKEDTRFTEYAGMISSQYADYMFVAFALSILKTQGKAVFILPHGVLFRANKEAAFRKKIIEDGTLEYIIGLPDKLFINTDIPTLILGLQKDGVKNGVFFIDAKDEFEKNRNKNRLTNENIEKIYRVLDEGVDVERFAHWADGRQLRENDYNLNIPRYVDTFVPEELPDFAELMGELATLELQAIEEEYKLCKMISQLEGTTKQVDDRLKKGLKIYQKTLTNHKDEFVQQVINFG